MASNNKYMFVDFLIHFVLFVAALIHLLVSLLRRFLPITGFQPYDYIPGIIAVVIAVPLFLYLIISCGKKYVRFRVGALFLVALFLMYLISCHRWSTINQVNEFDKNKIMLYDTFVLFFFIYPVGQFLARWKKPTYFRLFLNIALLIASVLVLYVLVNVLHGRAIDVPSGSPICLKAYRSSTKFANRLELSCNPNGTGSALSIAYIISLILLFRNNTFFGKVIAFLYTLVHFIGLILTGSRTSISTTIICGTLIIFFCVCFLLHTDSYKKYLIAAAASLLFLIIASASEKWISDWPQLQADSTAGTATAAYTVSVSDYSALPSKMTGNTFSAQMESSCIYAINEQRAYTYNMRALPLPYARAFRNTLDVQYCIVLDQIPENTLNSVGTTTSTPSVLYTTLNRLLSGRLSIFGYAIQAINASPDTRRYGITPVHIFSAIKEIGGVSMYTHNQFLEVTLALGFPALFVFIGFLLYILFNSIRLFRYSESNSIDVIMPIFLLTLLMANMTEAFLMFHRCFASFIFFFLCGWVNERGVLIAIHHRKTLKKNRLY